MDILDYAAVTHRGTVKTVNEDAIWAEAPVFVVADGISGSHHGDIASRIVVDEFAALTNSDHIGPEEVAETLQRAHSLVQEAQLRDNHDSATTACGAVGVRMGQSAYWIIFNIGDSRVYRVTGRQHLMQQVSVDHSHVQELIEAGVITEEEALTHPNKNVITRAVGAEDPFRPDFWLVPMVAGDRLLLCSDGLLRESPLDEVTALVTGYNSPNDAVSALLQLALDSGARDNVSIIIVDVHREADGDELPVDSAQWREDDELTTAIPRP